MTRKSSSLASISQAKTQRSKVILVIGVWLILGGLLGWFLYYSSDPLILGNIPVLGTLLNFTLYPYLAQLFFTVINPSLPWPASIIFGGAVAAVFVFIASAISGTIMLIVGGILVAKR